MPRGDGSAVDIRSRFGIEQTQPAPGKKDRLKNDNFMKCDNSQNYGFLNC
jgi:hypothetical protein